MGKKSLVKYSLSPAYIITMMIIYILLHVDINIYVYEISIFHIYFIYVIVCVEITVINVYRTGHRLF